MPTGAFLVRCSFVGMNSLFRLLPLLPLAFLTVSAQNATTPESQRIMKHVQYLASPELAGRAPGTEGNDKAAAWLKEQFVELGLRPGAGADYLQKFPMTMGLKLGASNSVVFSTIVEKPGIPIEKTAPTKFGWKLGVDYQPYGWTESATVSGPVVFVGYGLSTKGYDDYAGVDVKGAVVIVIKGLPKWAESNAALKAAATLRTKATTARDKGAVAVCFVNEEGDSSDVLTRFGMDRLGRNSGIVAVQVRRTPCARIFPPKETQLFVAEKKIASTKKPQSFALKNTSVSITTSVEAVEGTTNNVLAILPGSDPSLSNEFIVVGAHFDHLGMGDENSLHAKAENVVHPGADDNASGTAGVLEVARRLVANPPKRSVLFMAFSGEEKGLVGSKFWTNTPTVPLDRVVAMINMDMIGRMKDNKLNVQATGTSTSWKDVLERAQKDLGLKISTTADGFGPSDHSSFTAKNIPTLFFFTGLHSDYHRPTDTYEKLDYDAMMLVLTMVERVIQDVAGNSARPNFTAQHSQGSTQGSSSSAGFKVTFGVIPDYSDDPQGLRITGVKPGSPAETAGLKADDVITAFGGTTIKNIYDLTAAMSSKNPGDVVNVTVLRDGKSVTMKATLTGR